MEMEEWPEQIEYEKPWHQKNREKVKEYNQRPENKAKAKEYYRTRKIREVNNR